MSSGLIIESGSLPSVLLPDVNVAASPICPRMLFVIGTPSMTISGALSPIIDLLPRRVILEAPPAPPALGVIVIPETLPSRELIRFASGALNRSSAFTICVAYVKDFSLRIIPIAVTTTSSSAVVSSAITKLSAPPFQILSSQV